MRNFIYVIAGILMIAWGILFWVFHFSGVVHILLALSLLLLINLTFNDASSNL